MSAARRSPAPRCASRRWRCPGCSEQPAAAAHDERHADVRRPAARHVQGDRVPTRGHLHDRRRHRRRRRPPRGSEGDHRAGVPDDGRADRDDPKSNGKVTGGMRMEVPGGYATAGFVFMTRQGMAEGSLEYMDHVTGMNQHSEKIEHDVRRGTRCLDRGQGARRRRVARLPAPPRRQGESARRTVSTLVENGRLRGHATRRSRAETIRSTRRSTSDRARPTCAGAPPARRGQAGRRPRPPGCSGARAHADTRRPDGHLEISPHTRSCRAASTPARRVPRPAGRCGSGGGARTGPHHGGLGLHLQPDRRQRRRSPRRDAWWPSSSDTAPAGHPSYS